MLPQGVIMKGGGAGFVVGPCSRIKKSSQVIRTRVTKQYLCSQPIVRMITCQIATDRKRLQDLCTSVKTQKCQGQGENRKSISIPISCFLCPLNVCILDGYSIGRKDVPHE